MKHPLRAAAMALLCAAGTAQASTCAVDTVPAATLLVPYFEVDLEACADGGRTTVIWVRNVSGTHQLAQVTLWGEYGVPVAGFPVYLPAMTARHIDLADVICRGRTPSTGAAVTPRSEFGPDSAPNFPACNATPDPSAGLPVANQFSPAFIADVQMRLTGQRSFTTSTCFGLDHGDNIARGYATIDDISQCSSLTHQDPGFLETILDFDNAYVGGFQYYDPTNNFAEGAAAVAIEAAAPGFFAPGAWTFYGRLLQAPFGAADRREPLPSSWSFPIARGGVEGRETSLVIWRETPRMNLNPSSCFGPPFPLPLFDFGQSAFDESGDSAPPPVVFPGEIPPADQPIAFATQLLSMHEFETSSTFAQEFERGTGYVNLQYPGPVAPRPYGQSWVGALFRAEGRYSDFAPGTALDSMCDAGTMAAGDVRGPLQTNPNTRYFIFSNGLEP